MKATLFRIGGVIIQWVFSLGVIWVVWRYLLTPNLDPLLFASPSRTFTQIHKYIGDHSLWSMVRITLSESVTGFAIGAVLGLVVALLIGSLPSRWGRVFEPIIGGFYAMPKFVLAPLLFIWLGTDFTPRVVLVSISVFPLVAIYSLTGIRTVDPATVQMMQLAGASRRQVAQKLILPHMAGYFAISLVLAAPHALTIAIGSEILFGASTGIGGFLYTSSETFQSADVMATLVVGTALALALFGVVRAFEVRILRSRGQLQAGRRAAAL